MCLRLSSLLFAVVSLLGCGSPEDPISTPEDRPPNIIFILADDLGYGDLGAYGQRAIHTPNIDRLATEGIRFTDFYAGSTVCAPSRAVLMTGIQIGRNEIRGNREVRPMGQQPLAAETVTVAEVMKDAGYATALIGKWGLGGPESTGLPTRQGFDYFFGYLGQRHAHNYYPEFLFRNEERVPLEGNRIAEPRPDGAGVAVDRAQYSHDLFADEALAFIEAQRENPFFLYLALTIPHANNEAGGEGMEVPEFGPYVSKPWPEPQKGLASMISRMDRDVGRMLRLLEDLGLDEQTIVFFTSDNGPHAEGGNDPTFFKSSGPLRGIKRALYEGGIRVPLVARWPGHIAPGTESDHMGYFGDVLATVADLAETTVPDSLDSISFAPTLLGQGESQQTHPWLYWEFYEQGSRQAVRMDQWKAVRQPMFTGTTELFDLTHDVGEERNIAEEYPDVVSQMEAIMEEAHVPSSMWTVPNP